MMKIIFGIFVISEVGFFSTGMVSQPAKDIIAAVVHPAV
jgi:hypothetical protein